MPKTLKIRNGKVLECFYCGITKPAMEISASRNPQVNLLQGFLQLLPGIPIKYSQNELPTCAKCLDELSTKFSVNKISKPNRNANSEEVKHELSKELFQVLTQLIHIRNVRSRELSLKTRHPKSVQNFQMNSIRFQLIKKILDRKVLQIKLNNSEISDRIYANAVVASTFPHQTPMFRSTFGTEGYNRMKNKHSLCKPKTRSKQILDCIVRKYARRAIKKQTDKKQFFVQSNCQRKFIKKLKTFKSARKTGSLPLVGESQQQQNVGSAGGTKMPENCRRKSPVTSGLATYKNSQNTTDREPNLDVQFQTYGIISLFNKRCDWGRLNPENARHCLCHGLQNTSERCAAEDKTNNLANTLRCGEIPDSENAQLAANDASVIHEPEKEDYFDLISVEPLPEQGKPELGFAVSSPQHNAEIIPEPAADLLTPTESINIQSESTDNLHFQANMILEDAVKDISLIFHELESLHEPYTPLNIPSLSPSGLSEKIPEPRISLAKLPSPEDPSVFPGPLVESIEACYTPYLTGSPESENIETTHLDATQAFFEPTTSLTASPESGSSGTTEIDPSQVESDFLEYKTLHAAEEPCEPEIDFIDLATPPPISEEPSNTEIQTGAELPATIGNNEICTGVTPSPANTEFIREPLYNIYLVFANIVQVVPAVGFGFLNSETFPKTNTLPESINSDGSGKVNEQQQKRPKREYHKALCDRCGLSFKHKEIMRHIKSEHPPQKKLHACSFCSCTFLHASKLQRHIVVNHQSPDTRVRAFPCGIGKCQKSFYERSNATRHRRLTHGYTGTNEDKFNSPETLLSQKESETASCESSPVQNGVGIPIPIEEILTTPNSIVALDNNLAMQGPARNQEEALERWRAFIAG